MELLYAVLGALLLAARCAANTESTIVHVAAAGPQFEVLDVHSVDASAKMVPDTKLDLTLNASHRLNREYDFASQKEKAETQKVYVELAGLARGAYYNIKVCWPATYPISLDIAPVQKAGTSYLQIEYFSQFYSADSQQMVEDLAVPVQVHVVGLEHWIPRDILQLVQLVVAVVAVSIPCGLWVYSNVLV